MMAGEDLLEDDSTGGSVTEKGGKKQRKPLTQPQKIGIAIGLVTIVLFIYEIRKQSAASSATTAGASTTSTPIDPETGYPEGSAADQSALAQLGNASGTGNDLYGNSGNTGYGGYYSSTPSTSTTSTVDPFQNTDPTTGVSYATDLANQATGVSTLQSDFSTLLGEVSTLTTDVSGISTTGTQVPGPTTQTVSPVVASSPVVPTAAQSATLAKLNAELARDSAGTTKGDQASVPVLKKQIAAVKARS